MFKDSCSSFDGNFFFLYYIVFIQFIKWHSDSFQSSHTVAVGCPVYCKGVFQEFLAIPEWWFLSPSYSADVQNISWYVVISFLFKREFTHSYPCAHTHTSKPSAEAVVQPGSYVVIASPPALSSSRPQDHLPFLIRVASPFSSALIKGVGPPFTSCHWNLCNL